MSQIGSFPQIEVNINNIWNHHVDMHYHSPISIFDGSFEPTFPKSSWSLVQSSEEHLFKKKHQTGVKKLQSILEPKSESWKDLHNLGVLWLNLLLMSLLWLPNVVVFQLYERKYNRKRGLWDETHPTNHSTAASKGVVSLLEEAEGSAFENHGFLLPLFFRGYKIYITQISTNATPSFFIGFFWGSKGR